MLCLKERKEIEGEKTSRPEKKNIKQINVFDLGEIETKLKNSKEKIKKIKKQHNRLCCNTINFVHLWQKKSS